MPVSFESISQFPGFPFTRVLRTSFSREHTSERLLEIVLPACLHQGTWYPAYIVIFRGRKNHIHNSSEPKFFAHCFLFGQCMPPPEMRRSEEEALRHCTGAAFTLACPLLFLCSPDTILSFFHQKFIFTNQTTPVRLQRARFKSSASSSNKPNTKLHRKYTQVSCCSTRFCFFSLRRERGGCTGASN